MNRKERYAYLNVLRKQYQKATEKGKGKFWMSCFSVLLKEITQLVDYLPKSLG